MRPTPRSSACLAWEGDHLECMEDGEAWGGRGDMEGASTNGFDTVYYERHGSY